MAAVSTGSACRGECCDAKVRGLKRVLPGFHLSLGVTVGWIGGLVLLPLACLVARPWSLGWAALAARLTETRVRAALALSFGTATLATLLAVLLGLPVAWVLVRYRFPGRRLLDAAVDLPFALPTAVAGIALAALYAPNGWLGRPLGALGVKVAYTPAGIVVALVFVALPFVVRTAESVLRDLPRDPEEAAATLGATRWQAVLRVVLPALAPAVLTGAALAFARAVGEYGSVIFLAGNIPRVSEIAPLLIAIRLDEYDYAGAAAIGVAMLAASALSLAALQTARRHLPGVV